MDRYGRKRSPRARALWWSERRVAAMRGHSPGVHRDRRRARRPVGEARTSDTLENAARVTRGDRPIGVRADEHVIEGAWIDRHHRVVIADVFDGECRGASPGAPSVGRIPKPLFDFGSIRSRMRAVPEQRSSFLGQGPDLVVVHWHMGGIRRWTKACEWFDHDIEPRTIPSRHRAGASRAS
jgi:hypothetical protein